MNSLYVLPQQKHFSYTAGQTVLQILQHHHLPIEAACGGHGTCGKCLIEIISGTVNPRTLAEESLSLPRQHRLSCQVYPQGDVTIRLPYMPVHATIPIPSTASALKGSNACTAYGVVIDIGTTTVVLTLVNMANQEICGTYTHLNNQRSYGADVLSRIAFATHEPTGLRQLHDAIIETITAGVLALCHQSAILPTQLQQYVISANTTMLHLLLQVSVTTLGKAPYTPIFTTSQEVPASTLGLPGTADATVYCLPGVSTFIGADIVSGAVLAGLPKVKDTTVFLDMGTNCEIILAKPDQMLACSCAAGPALEGANIRCGMTATPGAIDDVSLNSDGTLCVSTIGQVSPRGICGSGILAITALFCQTGIISPRGRFRTRKEIAQSSYPSLGPYLVEDGKKRYFSLSHQDSSLYITQQDIRQIQLAKGAIAAGLQILLETARLTPSDVDQVIIAGQFGQHMKATYIAQIGLIPLEWQDKLTYIGNSSQLGAIQCLLHPALRQQMETTATEIQYIDLSQRPDYERRFIQEMQFPEVIE